MMIKPAILMLLLAAFTLFLILDSPANFWNSSLQSLTRQQTVLQSLYRLAEQEKEKQSEKKFPSNTRDPSSNTRDPCDVEPNLPRCKSPPDEPPSSKSKQAQ
jgi:hypothetical protein